METHDVAKEAVRSVIAQINRAWRDKDFSALPECFVEDAVMVGPGYVELGRGCSFFIESYRDFSTNAAVFEYSESQPFIEIFGNIAICAYSWTVTYQRDDGLKAESGSDQFVLSRLNSQWRVVWRYVFFQPQS